MSFISRIFARVRPRELVGPPDPVSNIRPILFEGQAPSQGNQRHPYSLTEFGARDEDNIDLQWRFEREQLNAFNHAFWRDSNTRFMIGKQYVIQQFQGREDAHTVKDKEKALSEFYSRWSIQETTRQAKYTAEWNRRNRIVIRLTMRRQLHIWKNLFLDAINRRPT
ncbi:hypothetical protein K439DRAFT_265203 [Ramaria rubella]|nr:hypothetical protein K439DRAFT_265203 [Ramaria rubella]